MNIVSRVKVAISGGKDSAIAAFLLKKYGYQVEGVHGLLNNSDNAEHQTRTAHSICDKLNIPFEQLDLRKAFKQYVIDPFLQDYYKGLTPNPCIYCNRFIKFGFLFDHLTTSAADY